MRTSETLLLVGACANALLAVTRLMGIRQVMDGARPLALFIDAKRASVATVLLRGVFLYALFAACTFAFPSELLTTRLGVLIGAGTGGYLALVALEEFRLPELRTWGLPLLAPTGALAYFAAYATKSI